MQVHVIIRQLLSMKPSVVAVVEEPDATYGVDSLDNYFEGKANDIIRRDKAEHSEFEEAMYICKTVNTI